MRHGDRGNVATDAIWPGGGGCVSATIFCARPSAWEPMCLVLFLASFPRTLTANAEGARSDRRVASERSRVRRVSSLPSDQHGVVGICRRHAPRYWSAHTHGAHVRACLACERCRRARIPVRMSTTSLSARLHARPRDARPHICTHLHPPKYFFKCPGACRRQMPTTRADLKVPKDASHRDLSDATLRSDLAPRRLPSACAERLLKIEPIPRICTHVHHASGRIPARNSAHMSTHMVDSQKPARV